MRSVHQLSFLWFTLTNLYNFFSFQILFVSALASFAAASFAVSIKVFIIIIVMDMKYEYLTKPHYSLFLKIFEMFNTYYWKHTLKVFTLIFFLIFQM